MNENITAQAAETGSSKSSETRQLRRTHEGRILAGLCSGAGEYLGVDANIIRIALGVLIFVTGGTATVAYVIGWLIIPEEGKDTSIAQELLGNAKQPPSDRESA